MNKLQWTPKTLHGLVGSVVLVAALSLASSPARAQPSAVSAAASGSDACPPGAYCEAAELPPTRAKKETPPPAKDTRHAGKSTSVLASKQRPSGGQELIVIPAKKKGRIYVIKRDASGRPVVSEYARLPTARSKKKRVKTHACCRARAPKTPRRIGLSLRGSGALVPTALDEPLTMLGFGASLRFRPVPSFAVELGFDRVSGDNDVGDFRRNENTFSLNALVYAFPKSFFQPYLIGGAHASVAHIESDSGAVLLPRGNMADYAYVGVQGGAGLSLRLTRGFGVSFDGLGFLRKRVDAAASEFPEFVDNERGVASNVGGGVLLRTGLNFWW